MTREKIHSKPVTHPPASDYERALDSWRPPTATPPTISGRWLLKAAGLTIVAAAVCAWGVLCLLFWQGSWQLLYHPVAAVTRTPASVGLPYEAVGFAATDAGRPRLKGWWIPAEPGARFARYTVLCLSGQDDNVSESVDEIAVLHTVGANVLAFDYRGFGQSESARPSEAHWLEDAEWALRYLTGTRRVEAGSIVLYGRNLGANLALEIGVKHPELAGVVLRKPFEAPANAIFSDPRARLIPARWLVRDRFDLDAPAKALRIPSLWFYGTVAPGQMGLPEKPDAFQKVSANKTLVWLTRFPHDEKETEEPLSRWLDDLPTR